MMMDEPDIALSIRSCHKLVDMMKKFEKQGHQIIAAVQNPIVIESFPEVFSLEHKMKWMKSEDFIENPES